MAAPMEIGTRHTQPEGAARRLCWPRMAREGFTASPQTKGLTWFFGNNFPDRVKTRRCE
jgi:hypothetical protein